MEKDDGRMEEDGRMEGWNHGYCNINWHNVLLLIIAHMFFSLRGSWTDVIVEQASICFLELWNYFSISSWLFLLLNVTTFSNLIRSMLLYFLIIILSFSSLVSVNCYIRQATVNFRAVRVHTKPAVRLSNLNVHSKSNLMGQTKQTNFVYSAAVSHWISPFTKLCSQFKFNFILF